MDCESVGIGNTINGLPKTNILGNRKSLWRTWRLLAAVNQLCSPASVNTSLRSVHVADFLQLRFLIISGGICALPCAVSMLDSCFVVCIELSCSILLLFTS
jgi:hypothetical protein